MILKQNYLLLMGIIACWLESEGSRPIISDALPFQMIEAEIVDPDNYANLTKEMMLDNKLMRDMYLVSTDKVYTMKEIQSMIYAVASRPSINLDDAVTTIVNLKLIRRLHFTVLHSFYAGCERLELTTSNSAETGDDGVVNNSANMDEAAAEEFADDAAPIVTVIDQPICLSRQHAAVKESSKFSMHLFFILLMLQS